MARTTRSRREYTNLWRRQRLIIINKVTNYYKSIFNKET